MTGQNQKKIVKVVNGNMQSNLQRQIGGNTNNPGTMQVINGGDKGEILLVQATGIQSGSLSPSGHNNFAFHTNAQKINPYFSPEGTHEQSKTQFGQTQAQAQIINNGKSQRAKNSSSVGRPPRQNNSGTNGYIQQKPY